MDPVLGSMIAAQVISGLAQAYTAAQARGENAQQLAQIKAQYDALVPPNYNIKITDPPALQQQALSSPAFQQAVASPSYDLTKLQPEKLAVVGQLVPQLQPVIKEAASQTLSNQTPDQVAGRNAQLQALQKFAQVGAGGFDPAYQQKVQQAAQAAQTEAQGRQGALMDSFNRRGVGGSGLELAANMAGNAQTMNNLAAQNQSAAATSYQNQLQALSQGAGIGNNLQSQDTSMQAQNAAIINAFNQRMAANAQNVAGQNAAASNTANASNLANAQNVANTNVNNANTMATQQQGRSDQVAQQLYNASLANTGMNNQYAQQGFQNAFNGQQAVNDNAKYLANFQRQGVQGQNDLQTQMYNDALGKINGQNGIAGQQMKMNTQNAQDVNSGISGLGNAATVGAYYYGQNPTRNPNPNPAGNNYSDYQTPNNSAFG